MSDSKLRELERRWRESKSVEDEAAYLAALFREGRLSRRRLKLAALAGHEPAERAVRGETYQDWVESLRRLGQPLLRRVALAVAQAVYERYSANYGPDPAVALALESVRAHIRFPHTRSLRTAAERACSSAWRQAKLFGGMTSATVGKHELRRRAWASSLVMDLMDEADCFRTLIRATAYDKKADRPALISEAEVREIVRSEVADWALRANEGDA